jgi:hypothetical protein
MVYEAIEMTTRRRELDVTERSDKLADSSSIVMFRGALQMSILATCRLGNQEAPPIMARKIQTMADEPVRFLKVWDVTVATHDILYTCFDASPEALSIHAKEGDHPILRFVRSCCSYYVGAAGTREVDAAVANVEFTITVRTCHINGPVPNHLLRLFHDLCLDFGVASDAFLDKDPPEFARLSRVQDLKDPICFDIQDLSDAEWAEHIQKLENLQHTARKARD